MLILCLSDDAAQLEFELLESLSTLKKTQEENLEFHRIFGHVRESLELLSNANSDQVNLLQELVYLREALNKKSQEIAEV